MNLVILYEPNYVGKNCKELTLINNKFTHEL